MHIRVPDLSFFPLIIMGTTQSPLENIERKDQLEASVELVESALVEAVAPDLDVWILAPDARPAAEKQLVRMLDFRLLPAIILIFILNYIDVSTLSPLYEHTSNGLTACSELRFLPLAFKALNKISGLPVSASR